MHTSRALRQAAESHPDGRLKPAKPPRSIGGSSPHIYKI